MSEENYITRRQFAAYGAATMAAIALGAQSGCAQAPGHSEQPSRPKADPGEEDALAQEGAAEATEAEDVPNGQSAQSPEWSSLDDDAKVDRMLSTMSLHRKVAQMFVVTPEGLTGYNIVTEAGDTTRKALAAMPVGGLAYFGQNVENPSQTDALLANTRKIAADGHAVPLFLCLDEEGGTVRRIGGNSSFGAAQVGDAKDTGAAGVEAAAEAAATIAEYTLAAGFNVDFAPVCDVAPGPESSLYRRSFGADAQVVADMVSAQVRAFLEAGLLCTAKHFPGIGDPVEDSHEQSIFSYKSREELEGQLLPFKAAIQAGVPFVMVSHLSLPDITGDDTPACLSPAIVQEMLRDELGYDGIVITDSLAMKAISGIYGSSEAAVMAIEAGCDIPLMPESLEEAHAGVMEAVSSGRIAEERIDLSVSRILRTKLKAWPELFDSDPLS